MTLNNRFLMRHAYVETGDFLSTDQPDSMVDFTVIPLIVLGLLLVLFGLINGPWQADFVGSHSFNTASHWDRVLGNDIPDSWDDVERPPGYAIRRVIDGSMYVVVAFTVLCLAAMIILQQGWLYVPIIGVGLYGLLYTAMAGVTVGPLISGAGFGLMTVGAAFGALNSNRLSVQNWEYNDV